MNSKLPYTKYLMDLIMQVNVLLNEVIDNSLLKAKMTDCTIFGLNETVI